MLDRDDAHHPKAKRAWTNLLKAAHALVTSNYIMRTSGINTAFAFDKHFKEQGFTLIA